MVINGRAATWSFRHGAGHPTAVAVVSDLVGLARLLPHRHAIYVYKKWGNELEVPHYIRFLSTTGPYRCWQCRRSGQENINFNAIKPGCWIIYRFGK